MNPNLQNLIRRLRRLAQICIELRILDASLQSWSLSGFTLVAGERLALEVAIEVFVGADGKPGSRCRIP